MVTQEKVAIILEGLPNEFSIDELMDKLILLEKIEEGIAQAQRGEVYTTAEARELLRQWPK